jgi:hypothetical protein
MPLTILKATVVQWKLDPPPPANPTSVVYDTQDDVSLRVSDYKANNPDLSPLIAQYILKAGAAPGLNADQKVAVYERLLALTRDGLMQVNGLNALQVTSPVLPTKQ